MDVVVDQLDQRIDEVDGRVDEASERLSALEGWVADMEDGYRALLALGQEQVEMSIRAYWAIGALTTITTAQQEQLREARERMDAMREMTLVLEHMQENPIVVDNNSKGEMVVSNGVELKVEENKVVIPIPPPGQLVPIEDAVQVLPDELMGTQITYDLAQEDCPPSYE